MDGDRVNALVGESDGGSCNEAMRSQSASFRSSSRRHDTFILPYKRSNRGGRRSTSASRSRRSPLPLSGSWPWPSPWPHTPTPGAPNPLPSPSVPSVQCSATPAFPLPPALPLTCIKHIFAKSSLPTGKDLKRMVVARTRGLCLHSAPRCRRISAEEPLLRLSRLRRLDIHRHLVRRSPPSASVRAAHSPVPRNRGLDLISGRPVHVS